MRIGDILREARETSGYTLDDIQEKTKIQKRYLIAIENNNFEALPGRFYARAFIKEYSNALGLDGNELLENLDDEYLQEETTEAVTYSRVRRSQKNRVSKGNSFLSYLPTIIVVLLVLAIFYVAYSLIQEKVTNNGEAESEQTEDDHIIRNPEAVDTPPDIGNEEEEELIVEEVVTPDPEFEILDLGEGSKPTAAIRLNHPPEKVELVLTATERVYVDVKGEAENYLSRILEKGEDPLTIDITEETEVFLNVGYTQGLEIRIDGILLEYPTEVSHQRMTLQINRDNTTTPQ